MATFWPEADGPHGRNALRQALHVIREEVGPQVLFPNGREELWLDPLHFESDVQLFIRALHRGSPERALELYEGDFLNGFFVQDCPEFEFWVADRRAHLKELAARASRDLAHQAEGKDAADEALFWWRRTMDFRPYDEALIRRVIALLAGTGNRGEAIAEFESFRLRLESELGVEPSDVTLRLLEQTLSGRPEDIRQWIGDRRHPAQKEAVRHRRRPTDRQRI